MGSIRHNGAGELLSISNPNFDADGNGWIFGSPWSWGGGKMNFNNSSLPTMVTNGTFTGNASGWTLGSNWSYTSNHVHHATDGGPDPISQNIGAVSGKIYWVRFTVTASGNAAIDVSLGEVLGSPSQYQTIAVAAGTHNISIPILCTGSDGKLYIYVGDFGAPSGTDIDDVSVVDKVLGLRNDDIDLTSEDRHITTTIDVGGATGSVSLYIMAPGSTLGSTITNIQISAGSGVTTSSDDFTRTFRSASEDFPFFAIVPSDDFDGSVDTIKIRQYFAGAGHELVQDLSPALGDDDCSFDGSQYLFSLRIGGTAGSIDVDNGGSTLTFSGGDGNTSGIFTDACSFLTITPSWDFNGSLDSVSMKKILGGGLYGPELITNGNFDNGVTGWDEFN